MQLIQKLPLQVRAIAKLMNMTEDEVRCWYHLKDVRELFKNYNYGVITKDKLIQGLKLIPKHCTNECIYSYAEGVNSLIQAISIRY